jgi:hypothetical protein
MPVPGTITPEPLPVEDDTEAALPSASTAETWVVPPFGACSGAPGSVARIRDRLLVEQPLDQAAGVQVLDETAASRARLLAHRLDQRRHRLGRTRPAPRDVVEQREAVGDQDTARGRWRVRDHIVAEVARLHRLTPEDPVRLEVGGREQPSTGLDRGGNRGRELTAVHRRRSLGGDLFERAAQIGEHQQVSRLQPRAVVAAVQTTTLQGVAEDQVEDGVEVSLWPRQLDARARELDRRLHELRPWQTAVLGVHALETGRGARDSTRRAADPEDLRRLGVAVADVDRLHLPALGRVAPVSRRRDEEVGEPRRAPVTRPDEREATGTRPGERTLGDPGRKRGGHAGIDRVAALGEDPRASLCGEAVAGCNCALHGAIFTIFGRDRRSVAGRFGRAGVSRAGTTAVRASRRSSRTKRSRSCRAGRMPCHRSRWQPR